MTEKRKRKYLDVYAPKFDEAIIPTFDSLEDSLAKRFGTSHRNKHKFKFGDVDLKRGKQ